jgi:hypothetical protein
MHLKRRRGVFVPGHAISSVFAVSDGGSRDVPWAQSLDGFGSGQPIPGQEGNGGDSAEKDSNNNYQRDAYGDINLPDDRAYV